MRLIAVLKSYQGELTPQPLIHNTDRSLCWLGCIRSHCPSYCVNVKSIQFFLVKQKHARTWFYRQGLSHVSSVTFLPILYFSFESFFHLRWLSSNRRDDFLPVSFVSCDFFSLVLAILEAKKLIKKTRSKFKIWFSFLLTSITNNCF